MAPRRDIKVMIFPGPGGLQKKPIDRVRTASEIGKFDNAVQVYLGTGDESQLKRFRKLKLKDADGNPIVFLTDTAELDRLGYAGKLSFESIYARSR